MNEKEKIDSKLTHNKWKITFQDQNVVKLN